MTYRHWHCPDYNFWNYPGEHSGGSGQVYHQFRDGECWCDPVAADEPSRDYVRRLVETRQKIEAQKARKEASEKSDARTREIQENMRKSIMSRRWGE